MQGGGRRGYRIDAETAAGGGLVAAALTRTGLTGTDDSTAQGNQLVPIEPEVWQQQGSKLQPMGTMRRGNGNVTGGVPFLATTITARERKGPDSDMTSGNLVGFDAAGENRPNPQPPLAATGAPHVAYALRADPGGVGGGSVMTPDVTAAAVRRLTPVECERLQGYPDGWTAHSGGREQSDSARYRQLGNSIAVPVFAWVARRLVAEHRSGA